MLNALMSRLELPLSMFLLVENRMENCLNRYFTRSVLLVFYNFVRSTLEESFWQDIFAQLNFVGILKS